MTTQFSADRKRAAVALPLGGFALYVCESQESDGKAQRIEGTHCGVANLKNALKWLAGDDPSQIAAFKAENSAPEPEFAQTTSADSPWGS